MLFHSYRSLSQIVLQGQFVPTHGEHSYKACAIPFNITGEIKRLGQQFVSDGRNIVITFQVCEAEFAVKTAWIGKDDPVVKKTMEVFNATVVSAEGK